MVRITNNEKKILEDLLSSTPIDIFNKAVDNYNLQALYERKKNYLIARYFDGNTLHFSVKMRETFNKFQSGKVESKQRELAVKMKSLLIDINRKKRYKQPHSELVEQYNELAYEHQKLNKGINELVKLYKKCQKQLAT
jgi:hypothetical protein